MPQLPEKNTNNSHNINGSSRALAQLNLSQINDKTLKIKKTIMNILKKIEKNIIDGYLYVDFIGYLCDYLNLYSGINFDSNNENVNKCLEYINFLKATLDTPFIIFPTLVQVNFKKVINLMRAPLLNFRIGNNRQKPHDEFHPVCYEIYHDIMFHCDITHNILNHVSSYQLSKNNQDSKQQLSKQLNDNYININIFFDSIKDLYDYKENNGDQYKNCVLLFYLLHEIPGTGVNLILTKPFEIDLDFLFEFGLLNIISDNPKFKSLDGKIETEIENFIQKIKEKI